MLVSVNQEAAPATYCISWCLDLELLAPRTVKIRVVQATSAAVVLLEQLKRTKTLSDAPGEESARNTQTGLRRGDKHPHERQRKREHRGEKNVT